MKKNKIVGAEQSGLLPKHIAVIMDGNGRWAKKRLMPRSFGHQQGMNRMIGLLEHAFDVGIDYVTVYALSTENLKRPKEELDGLFNLLRKHFVDCMRRICARGVRLKILGDVSLLPQDVQGLLKKAEEDSVMYLGRGVNVALGYGSRAEIVRAAKLAAERGKTLTEENFSDFLYTAGQPDPDLVIRTGKEQRLSNFLLFQSAYAELYFSDKMFPEFSDKDLDEAIAEYGRRTRRFGKTDEQCAKGGE